MRESIAADHPFELSELTPADARAFLVERDQPFKVEIVDDLLAAAERDGTPMPPTTFYRQGPFIDLCRGPHVASTGRIGPFKLLGDRRARTGAATRSARCSSASTARPGRRRRSSTSTCGGARRRRSATTAASASSSTCSASTTSRRARRSGTRRASASGARSRARCASSRSGAATRRSARRSSSPSGSGDQSGHWDLYKDNMFIVESEDQTLQPQADELPRDRRSSTGASCARTATCRCATTSTAGSIATSGPGRCRG